MDTIFIPCKASIDAKAIAKTVSKNISEKRIGLISTAQFCSNLRELKDLLEQTGTSVTMGQGRPNVGQVLGCDALAARNCGDVEAFVYIGTGVFHPQRAAVETGKKVYSVYPDGKMGEIIDEEYVKLFNKKKMARIFKFQEAMNIGILVSTKPGQNKINEALKLKETLEKEGKSAVIIAASELSPTNLLGYKVDCFVSTACPRLVEDKFGAPCVDISEILS